MSNGTQQERRNVARAQAERKRRFAAALALAGMRQVDFARGLKTDPGHLSKVLNGERISLSMNAKIDAFIAKHLGGERVA